MISLIVNAFALAVTLALSHAILRHAGLTGEPFFSFPRLYFTTAALSIYVLIFLYYGYLLQRFSLSQFYPLYTALSILFVYASGLIFFGEKFSVAGLAGVLTIIIGVIILSLSSRQA